MLFDWCNLHVQPFYSTERITALVHDVEQCLNMLLAEEPGHLPPY